MKNKFSIPLILVGFTNLILFTVKLYIGIKTNSLCVYTDSINNLMDVLSATIACFSSVLITKKATKKHPFGFGRIEYILEFVMSLIIAIAGLYFAYTSIARLSMPTPVWFYFNFAIILFISALVKVAIGLAFLRLYKKTNSVIFKTVMLDSFLDACVTIVALISFSLSNSTGIVIDGFLGLAISIMITASGIKLVISSVSKLIGTNNEKEISKIEATIYNLDNHVSIKNIFINDYGTNDKIVNIILKHSDYDIIDIQKGIKNELNNSGYNNIVISWEE